MSDRVLAVEWSSTRLSVAMGGEERSLEVSRFKAEEALPFLEEFLKGHPQPSEIRVGRGPGNYSGIRQSLAWAFGYTAPGGIRLRTCASGQAQACRLQATVDAPFAILGDARRGVWWGAVFPASAAEWRLQTPEAWAAELKGLPVFSQEAPRLQKDGFAVRADFPAALDLLTVPERELGDHRLPLYLHPAV